MYVSARLDYALRALATLATQPEDSPLTVARLAAEQDVSLPYLGGILNELRREGLVISGRGRRSGYQLSRPAAEISVRDVVAALRIWPVDVHASTSRADDIGGRMTAVWQRLAGATEDVLSSVSLADLAGLPATAEALGGARRRAPAAG